MSQKHSNLAELQLAPFNWLIQLEFADIALDPELGLVGIYHLLLRYSLPKHSLCEICTGCLSH
jgi:hypothetical protein